MGGGATSSSIAFLYVWGLSPCPPPPKKTSKGDCKGRSRTALVPSFDRLDAARLDRLGKPWERFALPVPGPSLFGAVTDSRAGHRARKARGWSGEETGPPDNDSVSPIPSNCSAAREQRNVAAMVSSDGTVELGRLTDLRVSSWTSFSVERFPSEITIVRCDCKSNLCHRV